jgi:hypothetical protein
LIRMPCLTSIPFPPVLGLGRTSDPQELPGASRLDRGLPCLDNSNSAPTTQRDWHEIGSQAVEPQVFLEALQLGPHR